MNKIIFFCLGAVLLTAFSVVDAQDKHATDTHAEEAHDQKDSAGHTLTTTFLWIVVILIAAKLASLVERVGQPAVLGELVVGVILGNLVLIGVPLFEAMRTDAIITFLAELGVVILLFQIGLESSIGEMKKVGGRAFLVAMVGVILPFALGTFFAGPAFLGGRDFNTYLFIGATLTATSVGITARVFKDLGTLQTKESKIVLGAAVIDDVLGLIILAVVSAIVLSGSVSTVTVVWIFAKAVLFLAASIALGNFLAPHIGKAFSKIHTGIGMKFTLAISACLLLAFLAQVVGLAAIVGAFAAGLVLHPVHFKEFKDPRIVDDLEKHMKEFHAGDKVQHVIQRHKEKHIEDLIEPISWFFVPIFFIMTGFAVDLTTLANFNVLRVALVITVIAIVGKLASGLFAGKVRKSIVAWGMVPRGEVGLIFATIGRSIGVVSDTVFSIMVIMVILTTLITPPVLSWLIKRGLKKQTKTNPTVRG